MDRDMNILYILGVPLGYVMEWIYNLIPNYGWDIIIFTIVIRLLSIPLQLNQQKSMAKMSAFQPMIADIQKKYKDKPEKQQEELLKLQQEYGYKPTAGCMPMLVNFLVMFGVIEVVYRPLQRIFHIGADALTAAGEALTALGVSFTTVTRDTNIIAQVIAGESTVTSCFTPEQVSTITEFGQHMDFFGIDLTRVPQYSLAAENLPLLILPILAIVTMFISTHISMKASGQQMQGSMKATMYMMPLMSVYIAFIMPAALGVYWIAQSVFSLIQEAILNKTFSAKLSEEEEARFQARQADRQRRMEEARVQEQQRKQEEQKKKTLREKQQAAQAAKAVKAAKAATSTTEAGRVGDRPYARGRAYKADRYDET